MRPAWLACAACFSSACCFVPLSDCGAGSLDPSVVTGDDGGDDDVVAIAGQPEGERVRRPRGWCSSPSAASLNERVQRSYTGALRERGSAPSLRGRVVLVTVLVDTPRRRWTTARRKSLTRGTTLARDFLLREARRYGVPDLTIDLVTLDATASDAMLPPLATDANRRIEADVMQVLDDEVHRVASESLGASIDELADRFAAQGYRSVAFVAAFPFEARARDYALSESSAWSEGAELAFVFAGNASGEISYTIAHESLHLFGAEDLYALADYDSADRRDVMQVHCANAGASVVAGTTAWAIGWRDRPPSRGYPIAE